MATFAVHFNLGEHREGDVVSQRAELGYFSVSARLLTQELVAREAQNFQTGVFLLFVQSFQRFVLRGQAALGRNVNNQQGFAFEVRQLLGFAFDGGYCDIVNAHNRLSCCYVYETARGSEIDDQAFDCSTRSINKFRSVCNCRNQWLSPAMRQAIAWGTAAAAC